MQLYVAVVLVTLAGQINAQINYDILSKSYTIKPVTVMLFSSLT